MELQCEALRHLETRAPQLALPRVVPTPGAGHDRQHRAADATPRLVWMLT